MQALVGGSGGFPDGRVQETVLRGQGHLFPFVAVDETGDVCAKWLGSEMARFRQQETSWNRGRQGMTKTDHLTLNKTWREVVGPPSSFKNKL